MKKIFYDPSLSKWRAFEAPEKPTTLKYTNEMLVSVALPLYEKALAEAKENALEVGNPEVIEQSIRVEKNWINDLVIENKEYDWPGTAVIRDNKYYLEI